MAGQIMGKELENKKFSVIGLGEFDVGDWGMSDKEYAELLKHNDKQALVTGIAVPGTDLEDTYVDVVFDDGYEIGALSTYHLEGVL